MLSSGADAWFEWVAEALPLGLLLGRRRPQLRGSHDLSGYWRRLGVDVRVSRPAKRLEPHHRLQLGEVETLCRAIELAASVYLLPDEPREFLELLRGAGATPVAARVGLDTAQGATPDQGWLFKGPPAIKEVLEGIRGLGGARGGEDSGRAAGILTRLRSLWGEDDAAPLRGRASDAASDAARDGEPQQAACLDWVVCDCLLAGEPVRAVVVKGSTGIDDWQINLDFQMVPFEAARAPSRGHPSLVHHGFYRAARALFADADLQAAAAGAAAERRRLVFIGHSLGGTAALLLALVMVVRGRIAPASLKGE